MWIKLELIHNINEVGVSVQIGNYENSIFKKYNEDKSFKSKVDAAVKRIIRMKLCMKK